jgi:basic membrane lipoprotein Med (substrate-binding protein (PBP1-ABC) superfamily)
MTKQNKNRKGQATMEEIVKSGSQLILMHDDGTEQSVEEMLQDDPTTKEVHYKSWWNQFRGPRLQSVKMTEDEIRNRADDAWECGDYKEMINLMAELICRLEKKR